MNNRAGLPPTSPDEPERQATPLSSWSSIDWRFLLPPDRLTTVGYLGPVSDAEIRVLEQSGVHALRDPDGAHGLDVVVVTADVAEWAHRAATVVRPGGWVLLRFGTSGARLGSRIRRGRPRMSRHRAGQDHLLVRATYWHAPNAQRCSYLVALDDRPAVAAVLRRYHGVRFGLVKSLVARSFNRAGLMAAIARDRTVVMQRPGDGNRPSGLQPREHLPILEPAAEASLTTDGTPSRFLVTPWFEASRHVVFLYLDPRTGSLCGVAKLPRRDWDTSGIRHEGHTLQQLTRCTQALAGQVPGVHTLSLGTRPFLLESALHGATAGPELVRAQTATLLEAALDFVGRMPTMGTTEDDTSWFARLVEAPLHDVAAAVDLEVVPPLVERTLRYLEPLRDSPLPLVFEHGDLSHPNLLLDQKGRLAAVDWERSEPRGLPGHNLCFFLQYVAESLRSTFERAGQLRAFDAAFTGTDAWALPWLHRYATSRGIDHDELPRLVLATWARSSAGLLKRVLPADRRSATADGSAAARADLATAFRLDRDFDLWRHAVERFERLLR